MCILTQKTLFIRWRAWLGLCLAAAAPFPLLAGSGRVNSNGTIDCTINFRFAPDAYDVLDTRNLVIAASRILWDASEAQIRFGKVTLTTGAVNEDLADVWLFAEAGRAGVTFQFDGSGLGQRGRHISYYLASGTGAGLAHQFAHLALGLGDEYRRAGAVGACWGFGPCMETGALSEQNQCLMQQPEGFTQSEFCTEARHDLVRGDYLNCATRATPGDCDDHCEFFNHATGQYETSQQTAHANASCWRHLGRNFPFLAIPPNLPSAQLPGEFLPPTFVDRLGAGDLVLLILDRSANLARSTASDDGEVCHDGRDNNSNGLFDESPCTPPRLSFLQAAARAWLALANNRGVRAGLVSFNGAATDNAAFQSVNDAHLPTLNSAVNALTAGGGAAIGTALRQSLTRFDNEPGVWNKAAFLFSDGPNTQGEEPAAVAPDLRARGVRVFSISSDGASEDRALPDVAGATGGVPADSPKTTTLVNVFAQQWARYRNLTTPITLRAYNSLNASSAGAFQVAAGTPSVTLIFAGDLADMAGFGVRVGFNGPGGGAFDTATPNPNLRIVGDPYFLLVELRNLTPGTWSFELESAPGAASEQTGQLTSSRRAKFAVGLGLRFALQLENAVGRAVTLPPLEGLFDDA